MKRFSNIVVVLAIVTLTAMFAAATPGLARQGGAIDRAKMQRDLTIMEGILDKLLESQGSHKTEFAKRQSRGIYLENLGVLFFTSASRSFQVGWNFGEFVFENGESPGVVTTTRVGDRPVSNKKSIEQKRSGVSEFLSNYVDAIGQINAEEKITVIVDLGHLPSSDAKAPRFLEASARKGDLLDFKRKKLSSAQLKQHIKFRENTESEMSDRSIEIMAGILGNSLNPNRHSGLRAGSPRGIRVAGFGALFFLQQNAFMGFRHFSSSLDEVKERINVNVAVEEVEETTAASINELKLSLLRLVADYGHTLRAIGPQELVVVTVDLNGSMPLNSRAPKRLILTVQKRNLDDFTEGKLSFEQLRKRVEFRKS